MTRVRLPHRTRVLVLCYHALSDDWPATLSTTPRRLRDQIAQLVKRGWVATTFSEAVTAPPAPLTLAVTFDDGFLSVLERGLPELSQIGVPATVFVPTDWPGRTMIWPGIDQWVGTPHEPELKAMTWEELTALTEMGWEVGAHSCSHPHLSQLDGDLLRHEVEDSRAECERRLGLRCRSFAYPFGDRDEKVRDAVAAAGYEVAAGLSSESFLQRDRLGWPRVGVWHQDTEWRFRVKVSAATEAARGTSLGSIANAQRSAARGLASRVAGALKRGPRTG